MSLNGPETVSCPTPGPTPVSLAAGPSSSVKIYGLLITKDDHDLFAEWCRDQLALYDAVVCLDGSTSMGTRHIASSFADRLIYLHERDFAIPHKTDHGLRRIVHQEIVTRFGFGHWIMCCHADEFCYHDPRKIVIRAQCEGFDQVAWFSPFFYPHPDDLSDWLQRRLLPVRERFRHYHWSYRGDGFPWLEDRLYRADAHVAWDDHTHGTVRPHGLKHCAPFHPVLCHYKVVLTDPDAYERNDRHAHFKHHWEKLEQRTGVPFPVRKFEDLFVASVPGYSRCDHFEGKFPQVWNIGDDYCPALPADVSATESRHEGTAGRRESYRQAGELSLVGNYAAAKAKYLEIQSQANEPKLRALIANDLAALAAVEGEFESARSGFHSALELDPECEAARANLAELDISPPALDTGAAHESPSSAPATATPRIKVAILSFLFNWPSTGGGIVHTVELARFLGEAGYEVKHFYVQFAPWGVGEVTAATQISSQALTFETMEWNAVAIQARFRRAVDAFQPDYAILTDSWNFKPLLAEAVRGYPYLLRLQAMECLCPLNNVRLLPEPGGRFRQCPLHQLATPTQCSQCLQRLGHTSGSLHQVERELSGVGTAEYQSKLMQAFAEAEAVLVVNPLAEAMVSPFAQAVRVVTAGMDPARFPWPSERDDVLRTAGRTMILFAGIPEEWMKGFHVLRAACSLLWQRRQDFEVVATGQDAEEGDPFIRFVGWQSQEELPRYLRACDILVMPTIAQEALGRTAVEAMAAGRPVVASRIGGLPFTVLDGATGLLCEPGDPEDLARKLETLLDSPELRERFGLAGRRRFEEHYAWPVIIDRHYRPLLAQRRSQSTPTPNSPVSRESLAELGLRPCTVRESENPMVLRDRTIHVPFPSRGPVDASILNDLWVRDVYELRSIDEPLECVVDIGAHIGVFSVQVGELWPKARIIACEADPQNAELLRSNVRSRPRIEVVEAAIVADETERVSFHALPDKAAQNSGGGSVRRPEPGSVPITVAARSVRRLWADCAINACDLLKLDCEGSEVSILQALADANLIHRIRRIVGEWHALDARDETIEGSMQALKDVLAKTHDILFNPRRPGREGHFTARLRSGVDGSRPLPIRATS